MSFTHRHAPFYAALVCAALALLPAWTLTPQIAVEVAAIVFFILYLVLTGIRVPGVDRDFLKENAAGADEPVWVIFTVTFAAVGVAVVSLFLLINKGGPPNAVELGLSLASVALGWFTIHTMTALHYAHRYWRPDGPDEPHGGLDFPGGDEPEGYDFLYFSFVIGMTAQTSDVAVTKTAMRKLTVLHGIVSFFFNTVLVAAAVNVAVSLAS